VSMSHLCTFAGEKSKLHPELFYHIWTMRLDGEHHGSLDPRPVVRSIAAGSVAVASGPRWNCSEQSYQLRYERIAAEKGQITSQGSTGVHKGRVPAGSPWPLFPALLLHETNCPVDALGLSGFRQAARGTGSCLHNPQHKWILSANVKSV